MDEWKKFQALKFLNHKSQKTNIKWFDKLTTLSQVEGQIIMTKIQNSKDWWSRKKSNYPICLDFRLRGDDNKVTKIK